MRIRGAAASLKNRVAWEALVQEKPGNSASVIAIETEDTPQGMLTIARQLFAPTSSLSTSIRVSRHVRLAIALILRLIPLSQVPPYLVVKKYGDRAPPGIPPCETESCATRHLPSCT